MAPPRTAETGPAPAPPDARLEDLAEDARIMLQRDLALAKAELRATVGHATGAGTGFGVAVLTGSLALALFAVAAGLGLAEVVHPAVAFLLVGLAVAAVAVVAFLVGRRNLEGLTPVPHHTIENIKEDISWLRARMS